MILQADARFMPIADQSINCVVTSPPYWGLRDYGLEPSVWGGSSSCGHQWVSESVEKEMRRGINLASSCASTRGGGKKIAKVGWQRFERGCCSLCGAWRGSLGLEPTPELYVQHIVEIFREVWRALRDDGTVWLNLGDSYAQVRWGEGDAPPPTNTGNKAATSHTKMGNGLKPKDLCGIPWRVAFALQADGWYLRSDIIWSKPNPMPESVTDRPTRSHEYVFLLSKSQRYYFDQDAVREPLKESSIERLSQPTFDSQTGGPKDYGHRTNSNRSARKALCNLKEKLVAQEKWGDRQAGWAERDKSIGRNIRSVWTIATQPYSEAHFATFPEKLVEPCIKAGCPEGGIVLDPFAGSGTVGRVATRLRRKSVLLDLKYQDLSGQRNNLVQIELGLSGER